MQIAFNAYISRVLEKMTESGISLKDAKRVCREQLQGLETNYLHLADEGQVARDLLAV